MSQQFEHQNDIPSTQADASYTAFAGTRTIAHGSLEDVIRTTKRCLDGEAELRVVILEDATSREVDFDFEGTEQEVVERAQATIARSPKSAPETSSDEPIASEVSLLPRHWAWLQRQPESASMTLRRLIDEADVAHQDRTPSARAVTGRLMWAMARDLPDADETSRALLDSDETAFRALAQRLPKELRQHLETLLRDSEGSADVADTR